jgi:hydroxymethylglutaryl-CoA synthase
MSSLNLYLEKFEPFYREKIEPSLTLNRHIGNTYTASVHMARSSVFEHARQNNIDMENYRFLVGSYGSGLEAEFHGERVSDSYKEVAKKLDFSKLIDIRNRRSLSPEEYEKVHARKLEYSLVEPKNEFVWTGFGKMGERTYTHV